MTCNVHVHVTANILATMTLKYHAVVSFHHDFPVTIMLLLIFSPPTYLAEDRSCLEM